MKSNKIILAELHHGRSSESVQGACWRVEISAVHLLRRPAAA